MDWNHSINRNREALAVVIAGLIAMIGQTGTFPRPLRRSILRILRPAESALRRLIVIVAATLRQNAQKRKGKFAEKLLPDYSSFARRERQPVFALIDPRKRFGQIGHWTGTAHAMPRISMPGLADPARPAKPEDAFRAAALRRRVENLRSALKTLPRQARRLNRLMARRAKAEPGPGRVGPIRPGHPPGHRRRSTEPVDEILRDCHCLALESGFKPP